MLELLGRLIAKLIFDELTCSVLPFDHLHLPLVQTLLLGLTNHKVHVLSLGFLLGLLLMTALLVNRLLLLGSVGTTPAVILGLGLPHVDPTVLLFFAVAVLGGLHGLFHPLGLQSLGFVVEGLGVAHSLVDDLTCTLARFVDFLDGLFKLRIKCGHHITYLAFLCFEKTDPVDQ